MSLEKQAAKYLNDLVCLQRTGGLVTAAEFLAHTALNGRSVLRNGTLNIVDAEMSRPEYEFSVQGVQVRVPRDMFSGAREMYSRQVYFRVPGFDLTPADVVVDLGANQGLFTTLAALKAARVLAVEAQSGLCDKMRKLLKRNHAGDNVTIELAMVGSSTGKLANPDKRREATDMFEAPPMVELGTLLERHGMDRVDFLKCDIEGSEFDVFRAGNCPWLSRVHRVVAEVHSEFGDPWELAAFFRQQGFQVTSLTDDGDPLQPDKPAGSSYLFALRV